MSSDLHCSGKGHETTIMLLHTWNGRLVGSLLLLLSLLKRFPEYISARVVKTFWIFPMKTKTILDEDHDLNNSNPSSTSTTKLILVFLVGINWREVHDAELTTTMWCCCWMKCSSVLFLGGWMYSWHEQWKKSKRDGCSVSWMVGKDKRLEWSSRLDLSPDEDWSRDYMAVEMRWVRTCVQAGDFVFLLFSVHGFVLAFLDFYFLFRFLLFLKYYVLLYCTCIGLHLIL